MEGAPPPRWRRAPAAAHFDADDVGADVEPEPTRWNMPKNRGRVRVGVVGLVGDVSSWVALLLLPLPGGVVGQPLLPDVIAAETGLATLLPISLAFALPRPFGGDGGRNARVSVSDCSSRVVLSEVLVLE